MICELTLGDEVYSALCTRTVVEPLTSPHPDVTIKDAYHKQRMISRRVQAAEYVVGKKIGVTSPAVMNMLGVSRPDFGYMLDGTIVSDGGSLAMSSLIQPKAEGGIAFVLKKDLIGPGIVAWLANTLDRLAIALKAGQVILSDALAAGFAAQPETTSASAASATARYKFQ